MAKDSKSSFLIYFDYREHLDLLTDEECGQLLRALLNYGEYGELPELVGAPRMAFSFIKAQMDRDAAKYAKRCARNAENGAKGGRPKQVTENDGNQAEKGKTEDNPKEPTETQGNPPAQKIGKKNGDVLTKADVERMFAEFWDFYPKKKSKQAAFKAWSKIKLSEELFVKIMSAVREQKNSPEWLKDDGRFIPYPATWLNGGRWDDEVKEVTSNAGNSEADRARTDWCSDFESASDADW